MILSSSFLVKMAKRILVSPLSLSMPMHAVVSFLIFH
jgi:hypothetical protein